MAEEEVVVVVATAPVDVSPVSSDHKRKHEDLEPHEEEEEAQVEPVESSTTLPQAEAHVDSNEEAKEIDNSVPDAKRPRLEEEESESVPAVENGHQLQKVDVLQEDKTEIPTEEKTEIPTEEKAEQPAEEKVEQPAEEKAEQSAEEKADQPSEQNHQGEGAQDTSMENLETENVDKSSIENPEMENQEPSIENPQTKDAQHSPGGESRQTADGIPEQVDLSSGQQQSLSEDEGQSMTRKMEVPNNKVGVLIGKAGDTIRFLQYNSGAKIQITRDIEADRYASTRPVELIGSLENINKAEKLIKDVIAEADAGGSPSLVARGFGTVQASGAAEQIQIQVPNEKVGLIIGKGGETIKNLQTRSGARIQLIPQHLPEGDQSKERIVRVSGDKKHIEVAREMIKEVMNQPVRQSPLSGGYNQQQNYRPRGPTGPTQWGPRGPQTAQGSGYDYPQRGMYPSQNPQYMPPSYGGYPPQQSGPRGNFNAGWDQRSSVHSQGPSSQATGYDYYGQGGGHMSDGPAPGPVSNAAAPHGSGSAIGAPSSQVNYNYGQPQGMDYGHPNTYSQNAHPQQSYGHGYEDPKYPNQGPAQPGYGGHGNSQTGAYPQQGTQPGYGQQPYGNKPPAYNMPSQGPPQTYGMPRTSQPGEMPYQGPNPSNPSYGSTMPGQQGYPYASGGPTQQTYPYGSAPVANDGYGNQAPPHAASAPGYPQQQGPQSGYGQPGVQPAPGYAQGGAQGGFGPYPTQPGYGEQQPVANNAAYGGYQGHADPGYNSGAPTAAYGAPPSGQAGYVQPAPNQPGYEQQAMPQGGGYGNVPAGAAPGGYAKNVSPQPAGYNQYDATQMYGGHH